MIYKEPGEKLMYENAAYIVTRPPLASGVTAPGSRWRIPEWTSCFPLPSSMNCPRRMKRIKPHENAKVSKR